MRERWRLSAARWKWSARCVCGEMVSGRRWWLHKLRRGHQIALIPLPKRSVPVVVMTMGEIKAKYGPRSDDYAGDEK